MTELDEAALVAARRVMNHDDPNDEAVFKAGFRAGAVYGMEKSAQLCERERCRNWSPPECATQIRQQLIQPTGIRP